MEKLIQTYPLYNNLNRLHLPFTILQLITADKKSAKMQNDWIVHFNFNPVIIIFLT